MSGRRLALVTGASAGIGQALARELAARGWDLALAARRAERLEALAAELERDHGASSLILAEDLTDPAAPARIEAAIAARGRPALALINNAGFSRTTGFSDTPWVQHQAMLQVMLTAPMELTHRLAPTMKTEGFGRILNVASVAGLLPATGGDTLYGPIKSFLIKATLGLRMETEGSGVKVSALCPGYVLSEFHDVNGSRDQVSSAYPAWAWSRADEVAREGLDALEAGKPISIPGAHNRVVADLMRLLPPSLAYAQVRRHAGRLGRVSRT
ncbi:SDR family NAD(P)-dependent oxidoreductase [Brevundimonas sp. 2R-24]|uniref:SDR family NAD(P)-dependent oxidoreductase n=1 Tax=Peiella sedimenti TaxID=3061083 RepID=A0ABT8SKH6_9CAUL|nr:SDR family NAD(P)-dependent oxidoreductase [Caulobacteraceae bacterium XZ-24]